MVSRSKYTDFLKDISPDPAHIDRCSYQYDFHDKLANNNPPQILGLDQSRTIPFSPRAVESDEEYPKVKLVVDGAYEGLKAFLFPPAYPWGLLPAGAGWVGKGLMKVGKKKNYPYLIATGSILGLIGNFWGALSNANLDLSKPLSHPDNAAKFDGLEGNLEGMKYYMEGISRACGDTIVMTRRGNYQDSSNKETMHSMHIGKCPILSPSGRMTSEVKKMIKEISKNPKAILNTLESGDRFSIEVLKNDHGYIAYITYRYQTWTRRTGFEYGNIPQLLNSRIDEDVLLCIVKDHNGQSNLRDLLNEISLNYFSHLIAFVNSSLWFRSLIS